MEIVFLLVGLFFVAVGALLVVSEARTRLGAVHVPARLIGFSTGASASGGSSFYAVAQYVGLDGQTRYVQASVGASSPLGSVGDALCVCLQPADPEQAAIKSALPYVLGIVLASMGLVACIVFFATFRVTPFSLIGAIAVVGSGAWKVHGWLRDKPISLQAAWRRYRNRHSDARVYTDATKEDIRWADPTALDSAFRNQQKTNRFAAPALLLGGAGIVILGVCLHLRTQAFLERAVQGRGVVVELVANHSSDGTTWAPVVEFELDGRTYRFKDSVSSSPASWSTGDGVDVLYDPSNPSDARIDRGRWNKAVPDLVAAFGVLMFSLGVWTMSRRRARRQLTVSAL